MSAATRVMPAHGTESRYHGNEHRKPCRCDLCRNGWNRAHQRRALAHLEGRPPKIPAGPVTAHLRRLLDSGLSYSQIARSSGANRDTVTQHALGNFPTIRRTTAQQILAVRPHHIDSLSRVDALGTRRRIQALYAAGHGAYLVAAETGLSPRGIEYILNGERDTVTAATRDAIVTAYTVLSVTPGSSPTARNRATREGWPGPAYWDDDAFDDPTFQPAVTVTAKRSEIVAEDATWLLGNGRTLEQAAQQLGISRFYVDRSLREARDRKRVPA